MTTFEPPIPALVSPKRTIGPFSVMLVIEEIATDELEITQHPVQQGAAITDHAYVKPSSVAIKILFDDTDAPLRETYTKLLKLQSDRVPIDVVTGKRAYKNMLVKTLAQTTDKQTENVLSVSVTLQEVLITSVEVVTVPERSKQRKPGKTGATQKAGQKSATPANAAQTKNVSAAKTLFG